MSIVHIDSLEHNYTMEYRGSNIDCARKWTLDHPPYTPQTPQKHTQNTHNTSYLASPTRHQSDTWQDVVCVDDTDASNGDRTSEGDQLYVDADPDSDDEDQGADLESEGYRRNRWPRRPPFHPRQKSISRHGNIRLEVLHGDFRRPQVSEFYPPRPEPETWRPSEQHQDLRLQDPPVGARADGLLEATANTVKSNLPGFAVFAPAYLSLAVKRTAINYLGSGRAAVHAAYLTGCGLHPVCNFVFDFF